MTGISSVTVNNMVDDTGDGISGTPYNKTFMQSVINDLIATALPLDGSVAMTGALQELFIGLIRKLNPNGTAHIYEYAGGLLASTTSPTGTGFQQAWVYNVPLATTTVPPTVNSWGGRDITDLCVLVQFLDTGVFEIWFAPSAAAGAAPVWGTTPVYSFNTSTGLINTASANIPNGAILPQHLFKSSSQITLFNQSAAPTRWTTYIPTNAVVDFYNIKNNRNTTRLGITVSGSVPPAISVPGARYRLQTSKAYFSAVVSNTDITTTNEQIGFFLSSGATATSGSTDIIGIYFDTATGLIKTYVKAASVVHGTVYSQAYTASTIYRFTIVVSSTSISFYVGSTLLGTLTTGLPANTVDLYPIFCTVSQSSGYTGCDFNIYEAFESLDDGLI